MTKFHIENGAARIDVRVPTMFYADELLHLKCGPELLQLGLFPNYKEVSESFGAYRAARKHLFRSGFAPDDPNITCVVIGDGATPRTAAVFAYRTRWTCFSVDPLLRLGVEHGIRRLILMPKKLDEIRCATPTVVVGVHAHITLEEAVRRVVAPRLAYIWMPCCIKEEVMPAGATSFEDWHIWSPKRTIWVWNPHAASVPLEMVLRWDAERDPPHVVTDHNLSPAQAKVVVERMRSDKLPVFTMEQSAPHPDEPQRSSEECPRCLAAVANITLHSGDPG